MAKYEPIELRFWRYVDKRGPILQKQLGACWIWVGVLFCKGKPAGAGKSTARAYGMFNICSRPAIAHRVSYELHFGPIPEGFVVRHKCDNPKCVRPSHLLLGTHKQNFQDAVARGHRPDVKLTQAEVAEIRLMPIVYGQARVLAKKYGISEAQMSRIRHGKQWK